MAPTVTRPTGKNDGKAAFCLKPAVSFKADGRNESHMQFA
jgi:hypothetical protein